ncbi:MAG: ATP-binding protein [Bacteroidales bacterium]|jgi:hypothetical protein|nr:ATP-binding protein [Bacteroidales bacterium]
MLENRKLPVGVQDFEKLRRGRNIYVDKTQYIYQLVNSDAPYFLGRPRRFGKSLFLSTLKTYFLGKKELFDGLAIAELEEDWLEYPVIYIDLNKVNCGNVNILNNLLDYILDEYENKWGVTNKPKEISLRFDNLIKHAYEKTKRKVVVLVDEYDKPLLETMDNLTVNEEIRKILKGFYGVLKSADAYLRFVFLTGVTKFSKVSIFSDLNQLMDISMDEQYAGICGISEAELIHNFQPELKALAAKEGITPEEAFASMKKRYDGYHFAKESEDMYNPFSVLNTFAKLDFRYYWIQTGTPSFLVKMLKEGNFEVPDLEDNIHASLEEITDYRVEDENPVPILYQSGYLTIKKYNKEDDEYILGFPNEEVKYGFLMKLLPAYAPSYKKRHYFSALYFAQAIRVGDVDKFMTSLQSFLATIPYDAITQEHRDEKYYQYTFYMVFSLMGQFVKTEEKNNIGRADAIVETATHIYVFEFKMDENATAEDALKQINTKGYAIPYKPDHRKIVKIGVEFSKKERNVKRWVIDSD